MFLEFYAVCPSGDILAFRHFENFYFDTNICMCNLGKITGQFLAHSSTFRCYDLSCRCGRTGTWRRKWERLKAGESNGKLPARTCPGCSVPTRPVRLNTNEWICMCVYIYMYIYIYIHWGFIFVRETQVFTLISWASKRKILSTNAKLPAPM